MTRQPIAVYQEAPPLLEYLALNIADYPSVKVAHYVLSS
jgi:hypothetical protein